MEQAALSVTANRAKNPQSQGLTNAQTRIVENIEKHADNGPERVTRPERMLSPRISDRPTHAAFGERPMPRGLASSERPLPPGLAGRDRPLPPGHAR